jgi:hypothetical protein
MAERAVWAPQPGSQQFFVQCPFWEALYEGTRGPGKTQGLLMDFGQHVGQGFGENWRGILFRETYPQLADVVAKSKKLFYQVFQGAKFNASDYTWRFPGGEELLLRHMSKEDDYWNYHGHEYPWIGWEELTNWASPACYEAMKSCSRSSHRGMPRKYRSNCNPYGVGHNWVKAYWIDPAPAGVPITDGGRQTRVRIHGSVYENKILLEADPEYIQKLESITDPNKRKAWLQGSWDIVAGGMFDDVWREEVHPIEPFTIPASWTIDRSFDWGSAKPFSVGFWAESDGTEATLRDGTKRQFPRGTLFRIGEIYGWNGQPNEGCRKLAVEVARDILAFQKDVKWGARVQPGPADNSVFDAENGMCIADDMAKLGVRWTRSDKSPGSRRTGWEALRKRLKACLVHPMEDPGLFVFNNCRHFLRTVPTLPRDGTKQDDVDTRAEDHTGDETRYRILALRRTLTITELAI